MNKSYTLLALVTMLVMSVLSPVHGQGLRHYWLYNQSLYNPAMTGSNEDVVGSVIFNQQQLTFPGAPRTIMAQANGRIGYTNSALGGGLQYQEYGVVKSYSAFMSYSYSINLHKDRRLMLGLGAGFGAVQENGSSLATTFNGDDIYKLNTTAYNMNVSIGIAYVAKKFWVSLSVPKLVHNSYDYTISKNRYSLESFNCNISAGADVSMGKQFYFLPSFMVRSDNQERFNADLNLNFKYKDLVWFGPYYRVNAAMGIAIGVSITPYLKLSYMGEMQQTAYRTSSYGNHEIMLGFKIPRAKRRIAQSPRFF